MATVEQYRERISDLGLDHLKISAASLREGREALAHVRALQKQLRQIKRSVNLDMKTIRAEYRERQSRAAATSSGVATLFGMRKLAGQMRADEKRRIASARDAILHDYDSVKLIIDDLLVQMDSAKDQIQAYISKVKDEEETAKRAAGRGGVAIVCRQCGKRVAKSDKFCRECGYERLE